MKILFLTQFYPPEVGATQSRMHHFARRLAEKGHRVTVVTELPNHPKGIIFPGYGGRPFRRTREDGLDVIRLWVYTSPRKSTLRRILFYFTYMINAVIACLLLARGRYDIIFATSPPLPVLVSAYLVSRFKRCLYVMDVRDLWPAVGVAVGELRGKTLLRVAEKMEDFLYRRAAAITCVTRSFVEYVAGKGNDRGKIFHLPNGTIPEIFHPRESEDKEQGHRSLRSQLGLEHKFLVGFCGNHGVAQGLPGVMEAARLLREQEDVGLLFVGEGPVKRELLDIKERNGLDNVLMLPQVPVEEISDYINACDVMLVPLAKDEIFSSFIPSKMFDYMACARPIILAVDGEARAIMEEAGAGVYVEPDNPAALRDRIIELRDHPQSLAGMGQRGREYVLKHYLRDTQADVLEGILSAHSRAGHP